MSEKHHAVYRISGGAVQTVTAVQFSTDCGQHGRSSAMAGGLKCSLGHKMEFVSASSNGRVCHFRHSTDKKRKAGEAPVPVQCKGCSMSSEHVEAQDLLQRNIHRIRFQTWKDCGVCAIGFFGPAQHATAKLEVPLRVEGRAIRADVAVYLGSRLVRTIEVKHTHATDVATRGDVPCLEVDARHVIDQCTRTATGIITLKGTVASKQECTEYCAAYENALGEFHTEIIRRAARHDKDVRMYPGLAEIGKNYYAPIGFQGSKLCGYCNIDCVAAGCSTCAVCQKVVKDHKKRGERRDLPELEAKWERMKKRGLVKLVFDDEAFDYGFEVQVSGVNGKRVASY